MPKETILKDEELKIILTWNSIKHNIYTKIKANATKLGGHCSFLKEYKN